MNPPKEPDAARLRITLLDLEPAPWREILVPLSMTFRGLNEALQAAFLWTNSHLWEFDLDGERYSPAFDDDGFGDSPARDAEKARLTRLARGDIKDFLYVYDMGDNWEHLVEIVELFVAPSGTRLPAFVDGQWRTPPEDIGGVPGFEVFLEAIDDPSHEDHDELVEWYGASFDREDFEPDIVKLQFERLAAKRRSKK